MRKLLIGFVIFLVLNSCGSIYNNSPATSSPSNTEREYNEVLKTYKSETAEVLTYLLNETSPNNPKTALTVENNSRCNMVLTVSSNNYYKKIPIATGKIGSVMILKNQTYKLSGMVCQSVYQTSTFISSAYSIKLSN